MSRLAGFLRRILNGEDVFLVPQTKEQWERQFATGRWDRIQEGQTNTTEIAKRILDCAHAKNKTIRVLDVGCGNGGLAALIGNTPETIEYYGMDISETAVASAKIIAPHGTFIVCDATFPPENLGVFDVLVFNEVLYYVDPRIMLPRYRSYTNSDTLIYISVVRFWRSWFIWRRIKQYVKCTEQLAVEDKTHLWDIAIGTFI